MSQSNPNLLNTLLHCVIELASIDVGDAGATDSVDVGADFVEHVRVGEEPVLLEDTLT